MSEVKITLEYLKRATILGYTRNNIRINCYYRRKHSKSINFNKIRAKF